MKGFDFIAFTDSQWKHLSKIEREHNIPWYNYIHHLVKSDIEGRLISPSIEMLLQKVLSVLSRPGIPMPPAPPQFDEEGGVKVSELEETYVDPNILADGTDINSAEFKNALITEIKAKLGIVD